ncbi:MAG: hypothetical protein ACLU37_09880 [Collinsella sp.]
MTIFVCAMAVIVAFTVLGAFFVQNTLADATSANLAQETELIAAALDESRSPSRSCVVSIARTCASR